MLEPGFAELEHRSSLRIPRDFEVALEIRCVLEAALVRFDAGRLDLRRNDGLAAEVRKAVRRRLFPKHGGKVVGIALHAELKLLARNELSGQERDAAVGRLDFREIAVVAKQQHQVSKMPAIGPFDAVDDGKARMHVLGRAARCADQVGQHGADLVGRAPLLVLGRDANRKLKAVSVDAKTSHALMKASRHGVRDNEPIGTLSFHLPGNQIGFALRLHDRRRPFDEVEPAALEQLLPGIMNG